MQFTQEQRDLAEMTADVFANFGTIDLDSIDAAPAGDPILRHKWKIMAGQGIIGALAPEDRGGSGLSDLDIVLSLEELGYSAAAEPVMETMGVVVPLLRDLATHDDHWNLLEGIVSGDILATVCTGPSKASPWAADADLIMMASAVGIHLLPQELWAATRVDGIDPSRRLATVVADLDAAYLLAGPAAVDLMHSRLAVGAAAVLNGVSRRLLDESVEYAKQRNQFGQPIGSFQAVKHLLADVAVAMETARSASWHASLSIGRGHSDAQISSWAAKSSANLSAEKASDHALQVHGGIGFTWEYELHIWMKRALSMSQSYGTTKLCHEKLGAEVLRSLDIVNDFSTNDLATPTDGSQGE